MSFNQRDLIPRWRSVRRSVGAGEFQKLGHERSLSAEDEHERSALEHNWRILESLATASELASHAAIVNLETEESRKAADFLDRQGDTVALRSFGETDKNEVAVLEPRRLVHESRARTFIDPRDALAWSDLARAYTACGELGRAERAMRLALWLAPNSRYILRGSTRLFVQMSEPDRAFRLLSTHPRTQHDPWLSAAFVSVGQVLGRSPKHPRQLRSLASSVDFRTIERSELQSELATLELRAGNHKKARIGFQESLITPTDNSLAQVAWALPGVDLVPAFGTSVPYQYEALAREAADRGDFLSSVRHCRDWMEDIPFDLAAATFGSFIAAVALQDWETAKFFARSGMLANPGDPLLLNNLIFAEAASGGLDEAERLLGKALKLNVSEIAPALRATEGYIAFQRGRPEVGRLKYQEALGMFSRGGDVFHEVLALLLLILQELSSGSAPRFAEIAALNQRVDVGLRRLVGKAGSQSVVGQLAAEARRQVSALSKA